MNKSLIFGVSAFAVLMVGGFSLPAAFAFYTIETYGGQYGEEDTETGAFGSFEEQMELATRKMEAAAANPATGSGTPYMDAGGVLGASAISAAIFGGIAAAFFFKGRSGKYAAAGRG